MAFCIDFVRFEGGEPEDAIDDAYIGYSPWDYLADFDEVSFPTREEAAAYIEEHYQGPDVLGVDAVFRISHDPTTP